MNSSINGMKSVMVFDPKDSREKTDRKLLEWWNHNQSSAVADKFVPGVEETRNYLAAGGKK